MTCSNLFRLPFDWKAPFRFLVAMIGLHAAFFAILLGLLPTISLFIGSCLLFISFTKDITNDLVMLNIGGLSKRGRDQHMRMHFLNIIKLHSVVKQLRASRGMRFHLNQSQLILLICFSLILSCRLVDEFNIIYEMIICSLFIWTLLSIASSLLGLMSILVEYFHQILKPFELVLHFFFHLDFEVCR